MDKKTKGAWLIHHARKIQVTTNQDFDQISFAGKAGILLSALSAESQSTLDVNKVRALAKANNISPRSELPALLQEFERQKLIDSSETHVEVLGLGSQAVLEHAATIFDEGDPEGTEVAVIEVSEKVSDRPHREADVQEFIEDAYRIRSADATDLLVAGREIGFFDSEEAGDAGRLLFNGNLFRRHDAKKVDAVLSSLSGEESRLINELTAQLQSRGCMTLQAAQRITGEALFKKVHSIGLFDVGAVGNEFGQHHFVTRAAAFSKFSNTLADDALDLAKALVSSLTYGMTVSSPGRGRIQLISVLMRKLIAGGSVGPATAIGKDYQALEFRRVVEVTPATGGMFYMRLLKPEVGRLALAVIEEGDVTSQALAQLPGANVTKYSSPEENREVVRRNVTPRARTAIATLLNDIRTGGLGR